ncbi:hypothetical protein [Streptomyces sp. SBT349]|uniref:hypothetical protein n=1 Tax=Streptomyces sp. SBT349 TaxID=1580539 RepID=UPI00066A914B|nr:hypothetical protein [Streptomyces sp. SBT349]
MFPDVTGALIAYLTPLVAPVRVVSRVPDPRPPLLVQVRRVGGAATPPVRDAARMDVWCWGPTDSTAMTLALQARAAVWALSGTQLLGGLTCYEVSEFLGPRLDDDPITNSPRAWATYSLLVRADSAINPAPH